MHFYVLGGVVASYNDIRTHISKTDLDGLIANKKMSCHNTIN